MLARHDRANAMLTAEADVIEPAQRKMAVSIGIHRTGVTVKYRAILKT